MENKYSNYDFREKVNLNFAVAYCTSGKIFKKLPNGFQPSQELEAINKFKSQHEAKGETVVVEYISINSNNIYTAFLNFFWSQLTPEEREKALYAACKQLTGKEFEYTKDFKDTTKNGTNHPFYVDDNGFYLNSQVLNSTTHPSDILAMLFCLPFEERHYKYNQNKTPKNILDFKNFEEFCCNKEVEKIYSNQAKKLSQDQREYAEADTAQARAYRQAKAEALEELMEEALSLAYLPPKETKYLDEEICYLVGLDDTIDNKLNNDQDDRDMALIKKANDHFNKRAIKDGRPEDVVEEAKAFEHFGFAFTCDLSSEEECQEENQDEYDGPIYYA